MECLVCDRIEKIKSNANPYFVREMETGYVVIGDHQKFYGYTLLLCKEHATELHHLDRDFKIKFLEEMSIVAQAVYNAFPCDKLNYELLGQGVGVHMHWHIFPRINGDVKGPVWKIPAEEMYDEKYIPTPEQLKEMKEKLNMELDKILKTE